MTALPRHFVDIWLFYESEEDKGMWVGHSVNTDQIAMGTCVLEAYVALKRVIAALLREARKNPKVTVLRQAPKEVRARLEHSRELPRELLDRAEELLARKKRPKPWGGRVRNLKAPVDLGLVFA